MKIKKSVVFASVLALFLALFTPRVFSGPSETGMTCCPEMGAICICFDGDIPYPNYYCKKGSCDENIM